MWTVYDHPVDYPAHYVVRRSLVGAGMLTVDREPWAVTESLEAARHALPPGLTRLTRDPDDDPKIVEVWL